MAVAVAKTDIPTFPVAAIEQHIRELLAEEAKVQATLQGTGGGGGGGGGTSSGRSSKAEPDIDSLVAVEVFIVIEPLVPFNSPFAIEKVPTLNLREVL